MEIKIAQIEDAPSITECVTAAYRHYIDRIGKPPKPMLDNYSDLIKQHYVQVLVDRKKIIGVLVLIKQTQSLCMDNVAVHPDYQGRGLGRQLITLAEKEARRMSYTAVTLCTNEHMTENFELYKELGFMETERKTEQGYQRVFMRKKLTNETI